MTVAPLLSITDLRVRFSTLAGQVDAVAGVSFDIAPGETLGLIGETGSGKSVLGMALLRLLPAVAQIGGTIRFAGEDVLALDQRAMSRLRGGRIGLIPQNPGSSLNPALSIGRQLNEVLARHSSLVGRARQARATELLARMGLPQAERIGKRYPHQLSGGMKQRALAAIGIAGQPSLLIADEPTKGLDAIMRGQVVETLSAALQETGAAMLLITHDLDVARQLCDRIGVMRAGRIVEIQPPEDLFTAPRHPYTQTLIDAHPARLAGRLVHQHPAPEPLISVRDISKTFAAHRLFARPQPAVRAVSLDIAAGETLAVVGASGCGKSTLGRLMLRLLTPSGGTVEFAGVDLAATARVSARRQLQILFQHPDSVFNPRNTLLKSLAEPLLLHRLSNAGEAQRQARALTEELGMPADILQRYPHQVSGGQLQRLALARILTLKPRFVVLDEPTSMLDVSVQAQVVELLQTVQRRYNIAYLFITHDLDLAAAVAHRIAVMQDGVIVELGRAAQIRQAPLHPYTQQLVQAFDYRLQRKSHETA